MYAQNLWLYIPEKPQSEHTCAPPSVRVFLHSLYKILQIRARKTFEISRKRAIQNMENAKRFRKQDRFSGRREPYIRRLWLSPPFPYSTSLAKQGISRKLKRCRPAFS